MTDQISAEDREYILKMIADLKVELEAKATAFTGIDPKKRKALFVRSQDHSGIELARHEADRERTR